jgi:uncharacterized phage protein (TIGR01671 family)
MKEIKFRGKKLHWEWVYWHYFTVPKNNSFISGDFIIVQKKRWYHQIWINIKTLWQYTWLKDKNGKEIYEGDILKWSWEETFEVYFDEQHAQYRVKKKLNEDIYSDREIDYYWFNKIEIIWNIYENPELIK